MEAYRVRLLPLQLVLKAVIPHPQPVLAAALQLLDLCTAGICTMAPIAGGIGIILRALGFVWIIALAQNAIHRPGMEYLRRKFCTPHADPHHTMIPT